jgi:hypothetical protein
MIRNNLLRVFFLLIIIVLISCSRGENYLTPESVVEANIKYMNEENFDEVMNTIYQDGPSYKTTKMMLNTLFKAYDLNYKIVSMKVIEDNNSDAKIEFVQLTTKLRGPDFKNNKITGIHTLKKDGDSWKILSTKITNTEYLN